MTKLNEIIDAHFDEQVQSLQELLAIPSVSRGEPAPGKPLGAEVDRALEYTLDLARKLGFSEVRSLDGYCGLVDAGQGEEMLMIMAHLDVVPGGPGWTGDAFRPEIRDGVLYGRGVMDDKGPAVSALYALQAVLEAGIPLKRRVRIFLGCDEEKDWACVERYQKTEAEPDLAFTPDGEYPVVHSEMNICQTVYEKKLSGSGLRINCGEAANVVPGEAEAELPFGAEPVASSRLVVPQLEGNRIKIHGRGSHASQPQLGQNALLYLLDALAQQPLEGEDYATVSALNALLAHDFHGEGFGLDISDDSGHLTLSPDMLHWDDSAVRLTLDCRCPFALTEEQLLSKLDETMAAIGFTRVHTHYAAGHYIDPKSELVQTLLSVYGDHTGVKAAPHAIGGGTYARAFHHAVGFGAEPMGKPSVCHIANECSSLEEIRFNTRVMADAIARLAGK